MTANLVPFGKYKGQPIERLLEDKGYAEWLIWLADLELLATDPIPEGGDEVPF